MIQLALFVLLILGLIYCLYCNKDIFSPSKFYHLSLAIYFVDIFVSDHNEYVYAVYLGYIFVGVLMSSIEKRLLSKVNTKLLKLRPPNRIPPHFLPVLWCISLVAIASQAYLVSLMGGFLPYVENISLRVENWRGLGVLLLLIRVFPIANLVYFTAGLIFNPANKNIWWFFYLLHLTLLIVIGLLAGSRGFLLIHFLSMLMIYHYMRKRVKVRYVFVIGLSLLFIAAFLGTFRQKTKNLDDAMSIIYEPHKHLNLKLFEYGTVSLDIIFSDDFTGYQYGTTFLAAITRFIPRSVWPNKFEPGGVILTQFAHGYAYTGTTNLSPGLITESILNFGYFFGIVSGFVMLFLIMILNLKFYVFLLNHIGKFNGLKMVYLSILFVVMAGVTGSMLYGEFGNMFFGLISKYILLSIIIVSLTLRLDTVRLFSAKLS